MAGRAADDRERDGVRPVRFYPRLSIIAALSDQLGAQPVPLVFDHFGGARAELGPEQPGFSALIALVKSDRKSTRLNSSHTVISYAVFCLKKKNMNSIYVYDQIRLTF